MAVLISDQVYFRAKKITGDGEGYYIMIKGSVQHKNIAILNIMHQTTELQNI